MIFSTLLESAQVSINKTSEYITELEVQLENARQLLAVQQQEFQSKLTAKTSADTALAMVTEACQKIKDAFGDEGLAEFRNRLVDITDIVAHPRFMIMGAKTTDTAVATPEPEPSPEPTTDAEFEVINPEATDTAIFQPEGDRTPTETTTPEPIDTKEVIRESKTDSVYRSKLTLPPLSEIDNLPNSVLYKYARENDIYSNKINVIQEMLMRVVKALPEQTSVESYIYPLPLPEEVKRMKKSDVMRYAQQYNFDGTTTLEVMRAALTSIIYANDPTAGAE